MRTMPDTSKNSTALQPPSAQDGSFVQRTRDALWNNPPVSPDMLTPEQKEHYAKAGERLYGGMDFENIEKSMCEGISYIVMQLKSGLHPDYLEQHDKDAMESVYGPDWRLRF
jgi:hypothetical protein